MRTICPAFAVLIVALAAATLNAEPAQRPRWQDLSPYQQHIIQALLPPESETWDEIAVFHFLSQHGTRSSVYLSLGMLLRNGPNDRANTAALIAEVLQQQIVKPGSNEHGIWRGAPGSQKLDQNWREFIGVGLIAIREWFPDAFDKQLAHDIDLGLLHAAEGASVRDVGHDYTNIALMSAFLLDYVGHTANRPEWTRQGVDKAKAIYEAFREHETFTEYNSPTYYGTDLMGLGLWCRLARSPELHQWGTEIEALFWRDIAQFYHADLRNLCGPYSRAYGMDMTRYPALTGLPIAFELDGQNAPLPAEPTTRLYEWAYTAFFSLLDRPIPPDAIAHFRHFDRPRRLLREIDTERRHYEIEARLEKNWMMGTVVGMNRPWEQHCPATVHWRTAPGGELGWLLVHGTSGVNARIVDGAIHVLLPRPSPERPLKLYLYDPALSPAQFTGDFWSLPGMQFEIETPLAPPTVATANDKRLGSVLAVTWNIPQDTKNDTTVLILKPRQQFD